MNSLLKYTAVLGLFLGLTAGAQTNSIVWHEASGLVDANVHNEALLPLLESIAVQTGWRVYVEPGATSSASTKFKNLSFGDALKMLLGDLNFALVPKSNGPWQLYVFRTTMKNATHLVASRKPRYVPNQLMVKVKPGTDINALAKMLGAKVVGRMDKYGTYLLQFDNSDDTDSALAQLQMDSDVQAVGYNNYMDPPPTAQSVSSAAVPQMPLTLNPPPSSGKVIVGLVDTAIDPQSLGSAAQFLLQPISVADGTPSDSGPTHADAMASLILQAIDNSTQSGSTSVQILPVDVYGSSATTTSFDVAEGIQAAINNGANVVNLSLGSPDNSAVLQSIIAEAAQDYGVTFFGAAGNTPTGSPYYPAGDPDVNPVTALQPTQPGQPIQLASYANSWDDPDMIALPGTGVFDYDNEAWEVQGTSTATAISSGIYAGNLAAHGWTQQQIISAMDNKFRVP